MLQKDTNNNRWKIIIITSITTLFLMSFNLIKPTTSKQENKTFYITSQTSSKELKKIEKHFDKGSINLKFRKVKRNKVREIYMIKIFIKRKSDKEYVEKKVFINKNKNKIQNFYLKQIENEIYISINKPKERVLKKTPPNKNIIQDDYTLGEFLKKGDLGYIITKNTKDSKLDSIINTFYENDIIVGFKNINRNSKGEIIKISIFMKSETSEATYGLNSNIPLKPIGISSNDDRTKLTIKTSNTDLHTNTEGNSTAHKVTKNNSFVFMFDNNEMHIVKDGTYKIISSIDTSNLISGSEQADSPIYFINGKESSKEDLNNLNTNTIDKINVIKGQDAIDKYGEKGKNGVILIKVK